MPGHSLLSRARWGVLDRPQRGDTGFTLLEVIVATLLFALAATATLVVITNGIKSAGANSDRVYAADLARTEFQALKLKGSYAAAADITATPTKTYTKTNSSLTYTITRTAGAWLSFGSASNCFSSVDPTKGALPVKVSVTGGRLTGAQTVTGLIGSSALSGAGTGSVTAILVSGSTALSGASVSLAKTGQTTVTGTSDSNGCYFASNLQIGTWTMTVSKSGLTTKSVQVPVTDGGNTAVPVTMS